MLRPILDVVLASASPRRKELLSKVLCDFEVFVPDVDEEGLTTDDPWQTARSLAWEKSSAGFRYRSDSISIGADTVVAFSDENNGWIQLAKPVDDQDAMQMLSMLSGKRHAVITAVAIRWPEGNVELEDTAWVTFRDLSQQEISSYVATGEPMDKAGAYAIQGGAAEFVQDVEGITSTVIGLPVEVLEMELLSRGLGEI